ncbi:zinc finger protein 1035 [Hoplias malabaricus]|uniref:zinc finger protein 1035 n=1 Tax=Hoplias malabaricus TaxID=27720 RepID=UPI0034635D6D
MMVSQEVSTSDFRCLKSEADPQQNTCHETPWQVAGKLVESEGGQSRHIKTHSSDSSLLESSSLVTGTNPVLLSMARLEGYSDVSSCSDADLDNISHALTNDSSDRSAYQNISSKGTNGVEEDNLTLALTDNSSTVLTKSDKEAEEKRDSDKKALHEPEHEIGNDGLNHLMDNSIDSSPLPLVNQCFNISSTEVKNECTLNNQEQMQNGPCVTQNLAWDVEDLKECRDTPTQNSSASALEDNGGKKIEGETDNDINGRNTYTQSECQLDGVSQSFQAKFVCLENESDPNNQKTALENQSQSDRADGKYIDQQVERSSFEFLQSCFGFEKSEDNPTLSTSVVHTKLGQHETTSTYENTNQTSQNCSINHEPPVPMKTCESVTDNQIEKPEDKQEHPKLHTCFKAHESSAPSNQNDCVEGRINGNLSRTESGLETRTTSEVSLVSSNTLMRKLQPVVLLKTSDWKAHDKNVYCCFNCKKSSQSSDELIEHYHCEHMHCNFQCCNKCGFYFSNEALAEQHLCDPTKPNLRCQTHSLSSEKKQKNSVNAKYVCRYCRRPFTKKYSYLDHLQRHTVVTQHRCGCCGLYFSHETNLKVHKRKIKCTPLIIDPQEEVNESLEMDQKPNVVIKNDGCQIRLHECFVKLVDVSKREPLPRKICCSVCGKIFRLRAQLKSHLRSHSDEKPFKCDICKKDFKYSWNLNKHKRDRCCQRNVQIHASSKPDRKLSGNFRCPLCKRDFTYIYNRTRHMHQQCLKEYTREGKGKVGTRYVCPLCNDTFSLACNRNRHLKKTCFLRYKCTGKKIKESNEIKEEVKDEKNEKKHLPVSSLKLLRSKCKLCPAVFSNKSAVLRHMQRHKLLHTTKRPFGKRDTLTDLKHSNSDSQGPSSQGSSNMVSSQPISCRFCEKCFTSYCTLKKHLRLHVGKKPFHCLECGKNFKRHGHLISHKSVHSRKIQCSVCKKILPNIGELLKHRQSHIKKGMLKCPDCPMEFRFPVYLLRHVSTHENACKPKSVESSSARQVPRDFKCGLCKKEFNDSKAMSEHCLTHMPKPSVSRCQFCKRNFQSRAVLIRHIRIHTGEKPFSCRICGKHFARKEYLKVHGEICKSPKEKQPPVTSQFAHLPEKSTVSKVLSNVLKCSYCPRVFAMTNNLTIHEKAHKTNNIFPCSKCGKYFRKRNMKEHQMSCNGSESQHACKKCGATFSEKKIRLAHESKCSSSDSVAANRTCKVPMIIKDKLKERCPHCPKRFQYRCYLLRHLHSHTKKKRYSCMHCGQKYDSKQQYLQHEAFCDGVFKTSKTKLPNDPETTLKSNIKEMTVAVEKGEFKCSICTKTFTNARNLRRHVLTHTDVKPYRCKACETCFSRSDHLKLHQMHCKGKRQRLEVRIEKINVNQFGGDWQSQVQQSNEVFECKVCSKQFPAKTSLARHIAMLHTTIKPYSCKKCGNMFSSQKSLSRHVLMVNCKRSTENILKPPQPNTSIQPCRETSKILQRIQGHYSSKFKFNCEYCPRRFKTQSQLSLHNRLHTGEKPYGCPRCGECFIRRDYLQRHSIKCRGKGETNDKVVCDRCGGTFTKDALYIHQKYCIIKKPHDLSQTTSTGRSSVINGFSCFSCGDSFLLFSQLQQHILIKHKTDGIQQSNSLDYQQLSSTMNIKEEPVNEGYIENIPVSNQVHANTNAEKRKPYACKLCNMRFIKSCGLGRHMRTHTAAYPLSCSRCSRGFWKEITLQKHKRKCTGLEGIPRKDSKLESAHLTEAELNDKVLLFNKGSKTTGTGVLQTNFSCKDQEQGNMDKGNVVHKYQCSECDQSFTDGLRLISHLEDHGREDQERRLGKKHQCHLCHKTFDLLGMLHRHVRLQHQESVSNTCPECFRNFRCPSDLDIHRSCHDPNRPFVCNICQLRFWTPKALRIHQTHAHPGTDPGACESSTAGSSKLYKCIPCNRTYTIKSSYVKHCKIKHKGSLKSLEITSSPKTQQLNKNKFDGTDARSEGESDNDSDSAPYFPCHVCGKTFLTSENLEDHQRCHLGEKPYECEECGKCFFQLVTLQQHQRSHKTEFQCNMCGKGFVSHTALRKHKHAHVTKRPHRCTKCHLSFTGSSQLAEHMIIHRDENFPCDLCDETFSCKSSRAEHRKSHTEQEEMLPPLIPPTKQISPPPVNSSNLSFNNAQFNYRCGFCQVQFQDPEQLSEHGCCSAKDRPYSCPECNKHFMHGSHLKKHQLCHHLSRPQSFQCNSCQMSFSKRQSYLVHMRKHGDEPSDSQIHEQVKTNTGHLNLDKIYKCPICPESFAQALELASHLSVHSHMCNVCNQTFATKQQLEEHEQCHLSAATQYECTECGDSFLGSDVFRQHNCARKKNTLSKSPHKKRSSGTSLLVISNVEEEEDVDVGEDFYNCHVCNKRFSSNTSLQEHQKLHEIERPYKCLVCGKGFAKKRYLAQHQQIHSERPYQCNFCSESFKTESSLLSHHKTHDATRKFQCSLCNKSYRTMHELAKHEQKHLELQGLEERCSDHRCDMCYKSFISASQLQKHQETHVGQIVYECTECDKAFAFLSLLEEHQQTHAVTADFSQPESQILFENHIID